MLALLFGIISIFTSTDNRDRRTFYCPPPDTVKLPAKQKVNTDSGEYLQINRIFIVGNKITKDQIILRELSFKPGDIVNSVALPLIIDKDQKRLFNTRLFNTATVRSLALGPGIIDLLVDVDERWYTWPSPRFDLSDRNFNEWWQNYDHDFNRVVYGLKLYQYNMRGRNETLLIKALFGFQRNLSVTYRIPYIDKKQKQGLIFNAEYTETKNLAYNTEDHKLIYLKGSDLLRITRGVDLTYTYRNSFYETHLLKAEYHSNWINDTIRNLNSNYFGEGRALQKYGVLSYKFISEHRDVIAYPLTGYQTILSIEKTGLGLGDDINKLQINLSYARYLDLHKGFYFSNFSYASWSAPKNQSYGNYTALGYQREFIKGYEVYVIEGPYYFLNKSTLKKRIFSRRYNLQLMPKRFQHLPISIYLKTYADFGYAENYPYYKERNMNTSLSNKLLSGIGGGFDIVASYDLVIRFEYTLNGEGNHGLFFHIKKEF